MSRQLILGLASEPSQVDQFSPVFPISLPVPESCLGMPYPHGCPVLMASLS